jgi:hypothetical protein
LTRVKIGLGPDLALLIVLGLLGLYVLNILFKKLLSCCAIRLSFSVGLHQLSEAPAESNQFLFAKRLVSPDSIVDVLRNSNVQCRLFRNVNLKLVSKLIDQQECDLVSLGLAIA